MEKKQHLHNYLKKGASIIYIVTATVSCIGLILDAVKMHHISGSIIYFNLITAGILIASLTLFLSGKIKLPLSFAIMAYALVANFVLAFLTIPFGEFEVILFLRNSFFFVYLMVLAYIIVNKANGIILTAIQLVFIIYGTLKIGNPFLSDSLTLFITVLAAFSAVTYYVVNLFEINIHELLTKNTIIEKQYIELNEAHVLLEERQQQIEEQSEELYEQKNQLAEINRELETMVATKDKFFSIIAHDLKNPMNSLLGFSELMFLKFEKFKPEKRAKMLEALYQSAKSINNLLENLLIWSRIQTGGIKENLTQIRLVDPMREAASLLKNIYTQKGIELKIDLAPDLKVRADKYMLSSVLYNLLSNAVKFTESGGSVSLSGEKDEKNGFARICVADTGVGIPEEDISRLFRTDQNFSTKGTNEERGTGLGLILCKEFIEKNGGKIWVKSQENKGSQFYFTLPLYKGKMSEPSDPDQKGS